MAYQQKSPGLIWRLWHNSRALASTITHKDTKSDVRNVGLQTGITAVLATVTPYAIPFAFSPFTFWFGAPLLIAGAVGCYYFGKKTYDGVKDLQKSSVVRNYMKQKTAEWAKKQLQPSTMTKVKSFIAKACRGIGSLAMSVAVVATTLFGLQYAGVVMPALAVSAIAAAATVASVPVLLGASVGALLVASAFTLFCHRQVNLLAGDAPADNSPANTGATPVLSGAEISKMSLSQQAKYFAARKAARDAEATDVKPTPAKTKKLKA